MRRKPRISPRPQNNNVGGRSAVQRPSAGRDSAPPATPPAAAQVAIDAAETASLAASLGRALLPEQAEGMAAYLTLTARWNKSMNLVGHDDPRDILRDLAADSWHLADFIGSLGLPEQPRTLDLGAGAGLPGIPLRLFWSAGHYLMVEVRAKRAAFLENAVARLRLPRTRVFAGRVEDLPADCLPADLVLSRAYKPWREYLADAARLVGEGGFVLVMAAGPPETQPGEVVEIRTGDPEAFEAPRFRLAAVRAYEAGGGERYFWAFTPVSIPR